MIKKKVYKALSILYRVLFTGAGKGTFVSVRAELRGSNIVIGENCKILKHVKLDTSSNPSNADYRKTTHTGKIIIGSSVKIKDYAMLMSYDGVIQVGDHTTINPFTIIYGNGGVTIGNHVMIAAHCIIVSSNHSFDALDKPIARQGITSKGITIANDVWIGGNVKILDGVAIGEGCVVAAGSVVTKDLAAFGIYGGVPARLIRKRADQVDQV